MLYGTYAGRVGSVRAVTDALCSTCSTVLPSGFRFCPSCGKPTTPLVEDVRKTMTLLFCGVSGSTALGEQLDPEVLRSLMASTSPSRARRWRHGRTVEKFVGDAVLAVFGIPVVREDDPLRAVRAGAEMRDALAELAARLEVSHGVRLAVRTGINTGAVVAGSDRAGGSFATGDAVNTAARLEQAATPGEVLVGESTYRLVRDAVEAEPIAPLSVKGKGEPLVAYRLLRMLDEALQRVIADSRCHLVTVLGAAGIGKTRLRADFEQAMDPSVSGRICMDRGLSP